MPFKNPEDKIKHNKEYKEKNKWTIYLNRIIKTKQKSVSQKTYDNIKDLASKPVLDSLVIKKSLKESLQETI